MTIPYTIEVVERFEEPLFLELAERVFGDRSRRELIAGMPSPEEQARADALRQDLPRQQRVRIGAFAQGALIGWTQGWFESSGAFYVSNSAVLPEYRRHGVYAALALALREHVAARGCNVIHSTPRATPNAVLIAKLKLGVVIAGMEYTEELGMLVKLVCHLYPERAAMYGSRIGPVGGV
jgi:ribosomal protein S18 acetylase RimI-like enzyme